MERQLTKLSWRHTALQRIVQLCLSTLEKVGDKLATHSINHSHCRPALVSDYPFAWMSRKLYVFLTSLLAAKITSRAREGSAKEFLLTSTHAPRMLLSSRIIRDNSIARQSDRRKSRDCGARREIIRGISRDHQSGGTSPSQHLRALPEGGIPEEQPVRSAHVDHEEVFVFRPGARLARHWLDTITLSWPRFSLSQFLSLSLSLSLSLRASSALPVPLLLPLLPRRRVHVCSSSSRANPRVYRAAHVGVGSIERHRRIDTDVHR